MTLAQTDTATAPGVADPLLVDDPAAELDGANLARFLEALWSTPAQLLVDLSPAVIAAGTGFPGVPRGTRECPRGGIISRLVQSTSR